MKHGTAKYDGSQRSCLHGSQMSINRYCRNTCPCQPRSSGDSSAMGTGHGQLPSALFRGLLQVLLWVSGSCRRCCHHHGASCRGIWLCLLYLPSVKGGSVQELSTTEARKQNPISEKRDLRQTDFLSLVFVWSFTEGQLLAQTGSDKFHLYEIHRGLHLFSYPAQRTI